MLALALALTSAVWAPADTASYVVMNHGRAAGEMIVISSGDSVVVKYHHVDRQRGPRSETRYRIVKGVVLGGVTWNLPLYGPEPSPRGRPADLFTVSTDSVRWQASPASDSTRGAAFTPGKSFYRLRSNTAYDTYLIAQHLLKQADRSANFVPGGPGKATVVKDTTLRGKRGAARVRFVVVGPPS